MPFRSNSAHDLGEDVDPEMLPDLETLQESFEIPPQLRMDLAPPAAHGQADPSRTFSLNQHQTHHQHQHAPHGSNQVPKGSLLHGLDPHSGHASGATTPSGPRSTASDESLHPGIHYNYGNIPQQPAGLSPIHAAQLSPARLVQSRSLPLLDDFENLAELQSQAADMLADVRHACSLTQPSLLLSAFDAYPCIS